MARLLIVNIMMFEEKYFPQLVDKEVCCSSLGSRRLDNESKTRTIDLTSPSPCSDVASKPAQ